MSMTDAVSAAASSGEGARAAHLCDWDEADSALLQEVGLFRSSSTSGHNNNNNNNSNNPPSG